MVVYTAGHGARSAPEFTALLLEAGVEVLVDVRRFPGSRRHPHFSRPALAQTLEEAGISYRWRGDDLGGRRPASPGSPHVGWREEPFRGFADHMETRQFRDAVDALVADATEAPLAVMCAETVWWRCHRRLIADALVVAGAEVVHLMGPRSRAVHTLTPWLRVDGDRLVYDRDPGTGSQGTLLR